MQQLQIEIINTCVKCDLCRDVCPENAVLYQNGEYAIDQWSCTYCHICLELCPNDSIKVTSKVSLE